MTEDRLRHSSTTTLSGRAATIVRLTSSADDDDACDVPISSTSSGSTYPSVRRSTYNAERSTHTKVPASTRSAKSGNLCRTSERLDSRSAARWSYSTGGRRGEKVRDDDDAAALVCIRVFLGPKIVNRSS